MSVAQITSLMSIVTCLHIIVSQRGVRELSRLYSIQRNIQFWLYTVPDVRFVVITAGKIIFIVL